MSKKLADLIHKTPWLGLLLGAVATLALLVLFSLPMQVIHLVDGAETAAERHAIQHEVRVAAGNRALDVAQGVVQALRDRTTDTQRLRELDRAMADMARARGDLAEAYTGFADDATESAQDAAEAAREAGIDAADTALEAAIEARTAVEDIRQETLASLRDNGLDASSAQKAFDQMLASARAKEDAARASLDALRAQPIAVMEDDATRRNATPPLELSTAIKDSIQRTVADDAQRVMLGGTLVLLAIPLLLALTLTKFFIGRARRKSQASPDASQMTLSPTDDPVAAPTRVIGWKRVWHGLRTVHGLWASLLGHSFIVLLVVLTGVLLACLLALLVGWLPVHVGDLRIDGLESLVIGSGGLLTAFGAVAMAIGIVLAVVYGLGLLFVALAVFIPTVILLGLTPVLAPLVLMTLGFWWVLSRSLGRNRSRSV